MNRSVLMVGIALLLSVAFTMAASACEPMSGELEDCPGCYILTGPFYVTYYAGMDYGCTACNLTSGGQEMPVVLSGPWKWESFDNGNCWCKESQSNVNCGAYWPVDSGYKACFDLAFRPIDVVWCYYVIGGGGGCNDGRYSVQFRECLSGPVEIVACLT